MRNSQVVTPTKAIAFENTLSRLLKMEDLDEMARAHGFVKRARSLSPVHFLASLMVCCGTTKLQWLTQLHRYYNVFSGSEIKYKPFHNQLRKTELSNWLQAVLVRMMNMWSQSELIARSKGTAEFDDIIIQDGSSFGLKDSLQKSFPGRFTKLTPAACEVHCTLSLYGSCPDSITVAPDLNAETHYRPDASTLNNKLLLADRMFEDLGYFQSIQDNSGFYIVRGKKSLKPTVVVAYDGQGRRQKRLEDKRLDLSKCKGKNYEMYVRWDFKDGTSLTERLLVLYKREAKNRKEFTLLHTNLSRQKYRISAIVKLYRYRWQVELFFKECKSYSNLKKFDTGIEKIAENLIWLSLCTAVFRRVFTNELQRLCRVTLSTMTLASSGFIFLGDLFKKQY